MNANTFDIDAAISMQHSNFIESKSRTEQVQAKANTIYTLVSILSGYRHIHDRNHFYDLAHITVGPKNTYTNTGRTLHLPNYYIR